MKLLIAVVIILLSLSGCSYKVADDVVRVSADAETEAVLNDGDAADDPAIWVHPENPYKSLIIGTNKKNGGLEVYDLSGKRIQSLVDGKFNNVDLRYGMSLSGKATDIIIASNRTDDTLAIYAVDSMSLKLYPIAARKISTLNKSYGLCMYHNRDSDIYYVFVNSKDGTFKQFELFDNNGKVDAREVRSFSVATQPEGCVADDAMQTLYVGEENVGIWRYLAQPDAPNLAVLIDSTKEHLVSDVEGLALYEMDDSRGYLLASSQGNNTYTVYDRQSGAYLGSFEIIDGVFDGTSETDGIDVISSPLGALYPYGMLVVQDGEDIPTQKQNFKMIRMEKVFDKLHLHYK
ncbi:MAG: phytase [Campylobacterota bacterium]|nr:phytase [Campylobacterota bacterium]